MCVPVINEQCLQERKDLQNSLPVCLLNLFLLKHVSHITIDYYESNDSKPNLEIDICLKIYKFLYIYYPEKSLYLRVIAPLGRLGKSLIILVLVCKVRFTFVFEKIGVVIEVLVIS